MTDATREYWDGQAADFDREADHSLLDPGVRRAWAELILRSFPCPAAKWRIWASEPPYPLASCDVVPLTDPVLWGKEISDERYLILSRS